VQSLPPVIPPRVIPVQSKPPVQQFTPTTNSRLLEGGLPQQTASTVPASSATSSVAASSTTASLTVPPGAASSTQTTQRRVSPVIDSPIEGKVKPILDSEMPTSPFPLFGGPAPRRYPRAYVTKGLTKMVKGTVPFGQMHPMGSHTRYGWPMGGAMYPMAPMMMNPMMNPMAMSPMFG